MNPTQFPLLAIVAGLAGLATAWLLYARIERRPAGTDAMRDIAQLIRTGAMAFLRREYSVLLPFVAVVTVLLAWAIGWRTAAAYLAGASCSILAGFVGMSAATRANVRTTEAARGTGQAAALNVAFSGGAVMGLAVASLGLLGIGVVSQVFLTPAFDEAPWRAFSEIIAGFAMGASSIALFARVGGGIYTKAADVGADLVGRSKRASPRTIRATPPRSPTTSATTWATSRAWVPTSSNPTSGPSSRRSPSPPPAPPSRTGSTPSPCPCCTRSPDCSRASWRSAPCASSSAGRPPPRCAG